MSLHRDNMEVILLTVLVSTCLAGVFIACFVREARRGASPERDSLLPLDDSGNTPR